MVNVLVTNGTIEEAPWQELLLLIDTANIDLKLGLSGDCSPTAKGGHLRLQSKF